MKRLTCLLIACLALPGVLSADDEKLVIAHYMTDMVPQTNRTPIRWVDPELADSGGSTAAVGAAAVAEMSDRSRSWLSSFADRSRGS